MVSSSMMLAAVTQNQQFVKHNQSSLFRAIFIYFNLYVILEFLHKENSLCLYGTINLVLNLIPNQFFWPSLNVNKY